MAADGGGKNDIMKRLEEYLPAKDKEKSELGEVFTPVSMIDQLYDHFPSSIWKSPTHTWLDPATGIGNFMIVLFFRLMDSLRSVIPHHDKRAKHIIEKMLFMGEINASNVKICRQIFKKLCPSATPNIYQGDFLTIDLAALKWPSTFKVVVGNPPYNIGGTGLEGTKRTHIIFSQKGLECLDKSGFLAYICPPSYRETNTTMNQLFADANGHFPYIKIYGAGDTFKLFKIQGRVDSFIYQKGIKGTTTIDDEYHVVTRGLQLHLDRHIPNFGHTIFEKLYQQVKAVGHVEAFRNTEMSSVKASTFGCNGKHKIVHLILEKGRRVFKTTKQHPLAKTPKLLINGLGVPYVFYDKQGEYGPSQSPVIILNPRPSLVQLLQNPLFSFIAWGLRLTGNNNLPYLFDYVPNVTKGSYKTMEEIQQQFHLTAAERNFITEHFHRYEYQDVDIIEKCVRATRKKRA
jgi:hypothetical protein